jgi:putative PIN family toxin of toxin-antitoxin system
MEFDETEKIKLVIDTNIFISSFFNSKGNPKKIIDLWKTGQIILCISEKILEEYAEVLIRLGLEQEKELSEIIYLFGNSIDISCRPVISEIKIIAEDPEDNMFIECAIANDADYIISGDKHLLELGSYGNIKILSPVSFLQL